MAKIAIMCSTAAEAQDGVIPTCDKFITLQCDICDISEGHVGTTKDWQKTVLLVKLAGTDPVSVHEGTKFTLHKFRTVRLIIKTGQCTGLYEHQ